MDRTTTAIERPFFDAFEHLADRCLSYVMAKHNLWQHPTKEENRQCEIDSLPDRASGIEDATDGFYKSYESLVFAASSPLMDEIGSNLGACKDAAATERYVFSILKHFARYSEAFRPTSQMNSLRKMLEHEAAASGAGGSETTALLKEQLERTKQNADRMYKVVVMAPKDAVEKCLYYYFEVAQTFAVRLDALLLSHGYDLMRLQRKCTITLQPSRFVPQLSSYLGSREMVEHYLAALPKDTKSSIPDGKRLMNTLDTKEARALLDAAKDDGLLDEEYQMPIAYTNADRALFASRAAGVLCFNKGVKYLPFEELWGVENLAQALSKARGSKKERKTKNEQKITEFFKRYRRRP
jgi:hypothetical protein